MVPLPRPPPVAIDDDTPAADDAAAVPAAAALAAAAAAAAPAAPAPAPAAALRVPRAKVDRVRDLLLMRLRTLEETRGADAQLGGAPVAAARQADLVSWYFTFQAERGALTGVDVGEEAALVPRIVQHLVRTHDALVVVEQPPRRAGEGDAEYRRRVRDERLLAANPNYADE